MINRKEKKGFLLAEEVLKVILAVIALSILAYLLFSLYSANKDAGDLELARESLDFLVQELGAESPTIEIYNPNKWVISSWPNSYLTKFLFWKTIKEGKPLRCDNIGWDSCICICKKDNPEKCDNTGVCLENLEGFEIDGAIEIKNPPVILTIDYSGNTIS